MPRVCTALPVVPAVVAIGAVLATTAATAPPVPHAPGATWLGPVQPLRSPAGPSSGQPQLDPSHQGLILSWIDRDGATATLRFSIRDSDGWTPARTVAAGDDWFVNWADVPSVRRIDARTLVAHWLQKSGASRYAYDVRIARSLDDGRTWSASTTPHHDGTPTEHGFASLFAFPRGSASLVWLDGRQTGSPSSHGSSDHAAAGGAMTLRFATYDGAWTQVADMPIDERVCDCCPTAGAVTSDGPIVAFRNRTADEVRDIHVSRFEQDRWTESVAVHEDGWKVAACPVNGPMLRANGRRVALAWFTAVGDAGHAYVAFSDDAGRHFGAPVRLDDESTLGRVALDMLPDGSAIAGWIELSAPQAQFRTRRITAGGQRSPSVAVTSLEGSRTTGYPRLAVQGRDVVFAWTDTAGPSPSVRTATATLGSPEHTR